MDLPLVILFPHVGVPVSVVSRRFLNPVLCVRRIRLQSLALRVDVYIIAAYTYVVIVILFGGALLTLHHFVRAGSPLALGTMLELACL